LAQLLKAKRRMNNMTKKEIDTLKPGDKIVDSLNKEVFSFMCKYTNLCLEDKAGNVIKLPQALILKYFSMKGK
jgi:hypothetical protein